MMDTVNIKSLGPIDNVLKLKKYYSIKYKTVESARLHILNDHVFRYHMSPNNEFLEYPTPNDSDHIAKITQKDIESYDDKPFIKSKLKEDNTFFTIHTQRIEIRFIKQKGVISIINNETLKSVFVEAEPLSYNEFESTQSVMGHKDESFFGGGMQNGRFNHKGSVIEIENTNNWVDGGVSSPCPFYWSSYGYGVLRNTWNKGTYDFGSQIAQIIKTTHEEEYFDAFYFVNSDFKQILKYYYELTGYPILIPKYTLYQAHLNSFNRDYWVRVDHDAPNAILFEDGYYYKRYKPGTPEAENGILESLNGENDNYQFSARAMIDRYKKHDSPLGWFIPNDGYGSGYGQTDSLDKDIENLKCFTDYSKANGIEVGLWTESKLQPNDPENPKKGERDLYKEIERAGIVALKCDVAWIGSGYSFAMNAVENARNIFLKAAKNKTRPFILMVDGWAGVQRNAAIWSGDQTGGEWEYIRFHIPTYIGSSLSGLPVIGSDMDGIFGGGDKNVNLRDYQWKAFTQLQLNMDGWGNTPKTPFSFDNETTLINRAYLKLKSMLMPYNYSINYEAVKGYPMIRAMFLEFPDEAVAYTKYSQYQYMWGPNILVAPIYDQQCLSNTPVRDNIYLPSSNQIWIDFFSGQMYRGGKILNNFKCPLWKLPVFIKSGAIIPFTNPNNNPSEINEEMRIINFYPDGESSFEIYDDDGSSLDYLKGKNTFTKIISCRNNKKRELTISINRTTGTYDTFKTTKKTELRIIAVKNIKYIKAAINGKSIKIKKAESEEEYKKYENAFIFKDDFTINPYLNDIANQSLKQKFLFIKIEKVDVTENMIYLKIYGYQNDDHIFGDNLEVNKIHSVPVLNILAEKSTSTSITVQWNDCNNADYYEIEVDNIIFTNIIGTTREFSEFDYESLHRFRIRGVVKHSFTEWSDILIAETLPDPWKLSVKAINVTSNIACQPNQEVKHLIDGNINSLWHTTWGTSGTYNSAENEFLKLTVDLGALYEIEKFDYVPRKDAGNGTILKFQYRTSTNSIDWGEISEIITWPHNNETKTRHLNGIKMRYMELVILDSVGRFGSGRQIVFYECIK